MGYWTRKGSMQPTKATETVVQNIYDIAEAMYTKFQVIDGYTFCKIPVHS